MTELVSAEIQRAVKGQYQLSFRAMVKEGWQKVYGAKKLFFAAWGWTILASFFVRIVLVGFELLAEYLDSLILVQSILVITDIVNALMGGIFFTALMYLMLRHINGEQVKGRMVFSMNHRFLSLFLFSVYILFAFVFIGLITEYLPSFSYLQEKFNPSLLDFIILAGYLCLLAMIPLLMYFLVIGRMISMLIIDKQISIWNACKISIKAVNQKWLKNILVQVYLIVFFMLCLIPIIITLGIALIWLFPLLVNIQVLWYKQIFNTPQ